MFRKTEIEIEEPNSGFRSRQTPLEANRPVFPKRFSSAWPHLLAQFHQHDPMSSAWPCLNPEPPTPTTPSTDVANLFGVAAHNLGTAAVELVLLDL